MKKTKRILMTIPLLIAAVFFMSSANLPAGNVQAASKGTYRAILQAYKRNDYRKVQRLSKTLPKNANEKCARKLKSKYRKAAKKVTGKMRKWRGMENYIPGIHWYAFSDINKNGKPELIVKYGGVETDCSIWVYEYKGGKYKKAKVLFMIHGIHLYTIIRAEMVWFYRKDLFQNMIVRLSLLLR
ncbi:hypothetical protein NIA73_13045 [Anaerobutyricum hallii]|nr:hypothetical protein [Anaerobutyricum hallii]